MGRELARYAVGLRSNRSMCHILICFVALFLSRYPSEELEGPNSTGVCKKVTMLIQIATDKYEKLPCYVYIYIYNNKFTEASHHNTLNITQNRWM